MFNSLKYLTAVGIRALSLVAKFLLMIGLVRFFSPSEVGLYGIITALIAYVLLGCGLEYYNFISRALIKASPAEQVCLIRDQFVLYGLVFLAFSPLILLVFVFHVLPFWLCQCFFFLVMAEHISNELMRILTALGSPYNANIVFFLRQGLWVFILLPLFYLLPVTRDLRVVLSIWTIGAFLSILFAMGALRYLPWQAVFRCPIDWPRIKRGLKISKPFMLIAFSALGLLYLERFFIQYYCGLAVVGIYTFYAGLSVALHNLVNVGVSKMRFAHLLKAYQDGNKILFEKEADDMFKYTFLFVAGFVCVAILLIDPFLMLINKAMYLSYLSVFYILLAGAGCRSLADVPLYTLYAAHQDRRLLIVNGFSFMLMLGGNILFVPLYGLWGGAFASLLASAALLAAALYLMFKNRSIPLPSDIQLVRDL